MMKINEGMMEDIIYLQKTTGRSKEDCIEVYKNANGDIKVAFDVLMKIGINIGDIKKEKEKKIFQVGDMVICTNIKSNKLTQYAIDFLSTYKYFKIIDVNDNKSIDLGYFTPDGKSFYFNPNRFELRDKPKIETQKLSSNQKKENDSFQYVPITKDMIYGIGE